MKKQILSLIIMLISALITNAQRLIPNAKFKVTNIEYKTVGLYNNKMTVAHKSSFYSQKIPKNRNPDMVFEINSKSGIMKAFNQVFNQNRLKQLLPEKRMEMTFYVNQSGQILEVSFTINKNTLLTAQELDYLEKAIKTNVSYKFRPEDINGQDFIDIGLIVPYNRVLDGSLN